MHFTRAAAAIAVSAVMIGSAGVAAAAGTATVGNTAWFPGGDCTVVGLPVPVLVAPLDGYSGGTWNGASAPFLQVPDYLVAAMDVQAGLSVTPAVWYVPGMRGDGLVVAIRYDGTAFYVPGAAPDGTPEDANHNPIWSSAEACMASSTAKVVYPMQTTPPTLGGMTPATVEPAAPSGTLPQHIAQGVVAPNNGHTYVTYAFGGRAQVVPPGWERARGVSVPELVPTAAMQRCFSYWPPITQSFNYWYNQHAALHESESYVWAQIYGAPSFGPTVTYVLSGGQTGCQYIGK